MDGRSFLPLLEGKSVPWRKEFLYEYYWEWNFPATPSVFALRDERYKYIFYHGVWDRNGFFDLQTDPLERHNLIKVPGYQEQISEMTITSPVAGIFIIAESKDLLGHYLKQGDPIAYVIDFEDVSVRVVVPQNAIGLVRKRTQEVELRLEGALRQRIDSAIEREIPAATYRLPSKALSVDGGGSIKTDPFDKEGVKTRDQYFQFEVALPMAIDNRNIGQRVFVRFAHGHEPLAWQWYRSFEELFLDELGRV